MCELEFCFEIYFLFRGYLRVYYCFDIMVVDIIIVDVYEDVFLIG